MFMMSAIVYVFSMVVLTRYASVFLNSDPMGLGEDHPLLNRLWVLCIHVMIFAGPVGISYASTHERFDLMALVCGLMWLPVSAIDEKEHEAILPLPARISLVITLACISVCPDLREIMAFWMAGSILTGAIMAFMLRQDFSEPMLPVSCGNIIVVMLSPIVIPVFMLFTCRTDMDYPIIVSGSPDQ